MKITFLSPGTGSYYCGACMRDNALAKALHKAGHEVELLPMYLPLSLDEDTLPGTDESRIFFGGINVFLQQKSPLFRHLPNSVHQLLNSPGLLRRAAAKSHMTSPRTHGEMTLEMLRLEGSRLQAEFDKLLAYLKQSQPDLICLSTALQAGMIQGIKQATGAKTLCFFQGEDTFLDSLPAPYKDNCWQELSNLLPHADALSAPSQFYADFMRERLQLPELAIEVLPNGIDPSGYSPGEQTAPPTIGYLARMMKDKGLEILIDAFIALKSSPDAPPCQLAVAGACTAGDESLVATLKDRLAQADLSQHVTWHPNISREEKAAFLSKLSLLSVPVLYPEAFGLYIPEALLSGVPIVQPNSAVFPEFIAATQGGTLVPPNNPQALATEWQNLLSDPNKLAQLSESGRRHALDLYTVDHMQANFTALATRITETGLHLAPEST